MNKNKIERLGEKLFNTYNNQMTIVEYKNALNIVVEFTEGFKIKTCYSNFKKGLVKSPYDKSLLNIGYLGEGFKPNEKRHQYKIWNHMFQRCYNEKIRHKNVSYKDCTICEEWHNFQNFCKWYDENYYEINGERMEVDKDILIKGNKIYSPENCVLVPKIINGLFERCFTTNRKLPLGVSYAQDRNKFQATCSNGNQKTIHLGFYSSIKESFYVYKVYKEQLIKQIADEYKDKIPKKLYNIMLNYEVEITD